MTDDTCHACETDSPHGHTCQPSHTERARRAIAEARRKLAEDTK